MLALDLSPRRDDSGSVVFGSIVSQSDPPADAGTLKEGRGQRAESRRSIKSRFKLLLIEESSSAIEEGTRNPNWAKQKGFFLI